jgi:dTDP-4-amino-4,6-dideoxygalactose transaminase
MKVPFLDVKSQNSQVMKKSMASLKKVMSSGDFILGTEVRAFEKEFTQFCQGKFALGVNSGTDALFLSLLSIGVGPGDEVICPVYTYIATALSVSYAGAKPVFVDIDPKSYNLDPAEVEKKITKKTKAIIAVHLYGNPADMTAIRRIAKAHKIKIIEDAAQAHGAAIKQNKSWQKVGTFGDIGCFSFYPTKNLSGCGDGGMILTANKALYNRLHMLRDQGRRGKNRYLHLIIGYNSRLDSLQAALLRQKLVKLPVWNNARIQSAKLYSKLLSGLPDVVVPEHKQNIRNVYHIYPIQVKNRDKVKEKLLENNIGCAVVYHLPLHLQMAYKHLRYKKGDFPVAEAVSKKILCLPMHSHLTKKEIEYVVKHLTQAVC